MKEIPVIVVDTNTLDSIFDSLNKNHPKLLSYCVGTPCSKCVYNPRRMEHDCNPCITNIAGRKHRLTLENEREFVLKWMIKYPQHWRHKE